MTELNSATPINRGFKERSGAYVPLTVVPDMAPLQAARVQIQRSINDVIDQDARLLERMELLRAEVSSYHALLAKQDQRKTALSTREAQAVADGVDFDSGASLRMIEAMQVEIAGKRKDAEAAKGAIEILQAKRDRVAEHLQQLRSELASANARWLAARHKMLTERFREGFHNLHKIMAAIVAVEDATDYRGHQTGWYTTEHLSLGIVYDSDYRADWLNSHNRYSIPGFAAAVADLEAEMAYVEGGER